MILRVLSQYVSFQPVLCMLPAKELQTAITNISIWRKGDQRAPHKPLLLLYVLLAYQQGHPCLFHYCDEIRPSLIVSVNPS